MVEPEDFDELREIFRELTPMEQARLIPELTPYDKDTIEELQREVHDLSSSEQMELFYVVQEEMIKEFVELGERMQEAAGIDDMNPYFGQQAAMHSQMGCGCGYQTRAAQQGGPLVMGGGIGDGLGGGRGGDFEMGCLAVCMAGCAPLIWNPVAYAACVTACTVGCHYL